MVSGSTGSTVIVRAVAFAIALGVGVQARAGLLGTDITTTSQVNADPAEMRTDTFVDPGLEIQFGDPNDFSWMVAGDSISFEPHTNPLAPYAYNINLGATHNFKSGDELSLAFTLEPGWVYTEAAITIAATVDLVTGNLAGDTLTLNLLNPEEVSQGDFGGEVRVVFNAIPSPGPATAMLVGVGLVVVRRRRVGVNDAV